MQIKKAEFRKTLVRDFADYNGEFPEIAFVGKSNVGKSSLINMLTNNSKLAYVSKKQGKTRVINYYLINDSFYFIDLPGYGFANASKEEMIKWSSMIERYFEESNCLKCVFLLMDIRRNVSEFDELMIRYAFDLGIPVKVVLTKADKIAKSKRKTEVFRFIRELANYNITDIVPVSSEDRYGKEELLKKIEECLSS